MSIILNQQSEISSHISELASFKIKKLECSLTQQTYVTDVRLALSGILLEQNRSGEIISIISTPGTGKGSEYLLKVQFTQVGSYRQSFHIYSVLNNVSCQLTNGIFRWIQNLPNYIQSTIHARWA